MWSESDGEREHDSMGRSSIGSEVVMMDERAIAGSSRSAIPPVSNLNVTKSSRVHIGNKFVSVTQNVHNREVVKGRFLGLELMSAKNTRNLRCSIVVFVCWALVVASGLAFYIFYFALPMQQSRLDIGRFLGLELVSAKNTRNLRCSIAVFVCWALVVASGLAFYICYFALPMQQSRLDIDLQEPWYLRRGEWQALNPYSETYLALPLSYVLIGHSVGQYCTEKYDCVKKMLEVQLDHLQRNWDDIGPNFLVSGNGLIFEGRGANVLGAMVRSWNSKSISVMFLGDYTQDLTTQDQFDHLNGLLASLLRAGVLQPNYTLLGNCQVTTRIISPGPNVMKELHNFAHWNSDNSSLCLQG